MKKIAPLAFLASLILLGSCSTDEEENTAVEDNFDRKALLEHWADDYIIPAYEHYHQNTVSLATAAQNYAANPAAAEHTQLHAAFRNTYYAWQYVSCFAIGPAEEYSLANYTNVYPTDTAGIQQLLAAPNYDLSLPSTFNEQGLPALDFLLSGLGDASRTSAIFSADPAYGNYLVALANRLESLAGQTLSQWQQGYRQTFVQNQGASANGSVNKLVNDFVYHFEKELRAGKVGLPAGVFSGQVLAQNAEAVYTDTLSKNLMLTCLQAQQDFFNGAGFKGSASGNSLAAYLDYLEARPNGTLLSEAINTTFNAARQAALKAPPSFKQAAQNNPALLLATYDELQKGVVLLKVDMLQALNVRVDYIDADGD
jgi:hypothetical protein